MKDIIPFIDSMLCDSGRLILSEFGTMLQGEEKTDPAQIVTKLDFASEKLIIESISKRFPSHSIIAEESGFVDKDSEYIWVIDPIDGTSNFANGVPWFGVMVALLKSFEPIAGGIYLPVTDELYLASKGQGAFLNGKRYTVHDEAVLKKCLVALHLDPPGSKDDLAFFVNIFSDLMPRIRNLRTTNSVVDYAYTTEGKIAGLINYKNKIWDDVAVAIIASEAGCVMTDYRGNAPDFSCNKDTYTRDFSFIIAAPKIHPQLLSLVNAAIDLS
jgi:myo-inositol-1(or 4)-monophosphatase